MKARLAAVLILVAAAALVFALVRFPAARRGAYPPGPSPATDKPEPEAATPREVVVRYIEALYRREAESAYALLSASSRQIHPFEEFRQRVEADGATVFDLTAAREWPEGDDRVVVTVPLAEDVAEAGFTTVREAGGWRVVFIGGAPWFPYPEAEAVE